MRCVGATITQYYKEVMQHQWQDKNNCAQAFIIEAIDTDMMFPRLLTRFYNPFGATLLQILPAQVSAESSWPLLAQELQSMMATNEQMVCFICLKLFSFVIFIALF